MERRQTNEPGGMLYEDETYAIRGACFEVYKEKGCGFLEPVYQECLAKEFSWQNIPVQEQPIFQLEYKGEPLDQVYRPDFVCHDKIVVELKRYAT